MSVFSSDDWLSDIEWKALFELYNNYHTAFTFLPAYIQEAFFVRLHNRKGN